MEAHSSLCNLASVLPGKRYYRFVVSDSVAVTADLQWMKDSYREAQDISGWIFGIRSVAEF
jgi:hypothetical protein